jgi:hypothetical protein
MNPLKPPLAWIENLAKEFIPQDEQARRQERITAIIVALIATLALLYQFLT